jgi:VCBS repeat-containing protein
MFAELLEDRTVPTNFSNTNPITIPDSGTADPYPSTISVTGLTGQVVSSITVTLNGLSHTSPPDIDALLVAPDGTNLYLMSDNGISSPESGVNLTFDDTAGGPIPPDVLTTGSYQPFNVNQGDPDTIPGAPAKAPVTTLSGFRGVNPNGTWELRINDDTAGNSGSISGGWSLNITSRVNTPPVANNNSYTFNEDTTLNVTTVASGVLGNDTDAQSDPLTAQLVSGPNFGTLTFNQDGTFSYVPRPNFDGPVTFTYVASDGIALSNVATVTLNITNLPDPPTAANDQYTLQTSPLTVTPARGVLANDTDPDGAAHLLYTEDFQNLPLVPFPQGVGGGDGTDFTDNLPSGWVRDNTTTPVPNPLAPTTKGDQYFGWHAMDIDSWIAEQGNQDRKLFTKGGVGTHGTVMVADGDGYDDYVSLGTTHMNTYLYTPAVPLAGVPANSLTLDFDSSYRPEDPPPGNQVGIVEVSFNNGTSWTDLQDFNNNNSGGVGGEIRINEHLSMSANNPAGATSAMFRFGYLDAGNDWWWAIDNVAVRMDKTNQATLTATSPTTPSHGNLTLNADGSFTYTPTAGYNGPDSFTYKVSDGTTTTGPATVNLQVVANNATPAAVNDTYQVVQGNTLTVSGIALGPTEFSTSGSNGVLANDTDADTTAQLTAAVVANPTHGALTLNADGTFVYTPQTSFVGSDTFTYRVSDGVHQSNTATVTINVTQVNTTAPVAQNDSYTVNNNVTLTVSAPGVLANDTDVDNNPLTAQLITGPTAAQGTLTLNADGSFSFVPKTFVSGPVTFTYKAFDGGFTSNTATVTITVNAVGHVPVANNDNYSVNNNGTLTVAGPGVLANDTDADNDPLTALVTVGPNGLVVGPNDGTLTFNSDGSFTYVPRPFFTGTDSFTYRVSDGSNLGNLATVTITVNAANVTPQANPDFYTTPQNTPLTVSAPGLLANDRDDGANTQLFSENFDNLSLQAFEAGISGGDGTDWTDALPTGWTRDNTTTPSGPPKTAGITGQEFFGWHALDVDSWIAEQGDQARSDFTRGGTGLHGTVLVADGDTYDDFVSISTTRMNTLLTTPSISLNGVAPNSLVLEFDSSFRPEAPTHQAGKVEVSYDNGATWNDILDLTSANSGGAASRTRTNEHLALPALNPASATSAQFRFSYLNAGNDWWWAIDNIKAVGGTPNAGVTLTTTKASDPGHGTVAVNANGSFTYTPAAGFFGTDNFTYTTGDGTFTSAPATVTVQVVNPAAPVQISSVMVNNGSVQRSMVTSITIAFNSVVTLPATLANAFQLARTGPGGTTGNVTLAVDLSGSTANQTIARLTFSGALTSSGSLVDGNYTLTVFGAQVTGSGGTQLDGDGNGTAGGDYTSPAALNLYRLYGDADGNRVVNQADLTLFRIAFGSSDPTFDFDRNGTVNQNDLVAFRANFGNGVQGP